MPYVTNLQYDGPLCKHTYLLHEEQVGTTQLKPVWGGVPSQPVGMCTSYSHNFWHVALLLQL